MNRKIKSRLFSLLAFTPALASFAGEPAPSAKQVNLPSVPPAEDAWQVTATPYMWMAGLNGTMGVGGYTADLDVPFDTILENLDMAASMQMEVKHHRWLLMLDGMYLKASADSTSTPGQLFSSVGVGVKQVMAEATLGYRLWEGDRGFLDVFAGARYLYVESSLSLELDDSGVRNISEEISSEVVDRVGTAVRSAVTEAAPDLKSKVSSRITSAAQAKVQKEVSNILANNPNLPTLIRLIKNGSGPVSDAIKNLVVAQAALKQATLSEAAAAVSAEVAAAKARARAQLKRAVTRAEKKLAKAIEKTIHDNIPDEVSASKGWVDPIVGFRARYDFTDRVYGLVRADIGGFGVSSELTWQVYAALGYQMSKHTSVELGYRHMYVDYTDGGFIYDMNTSGLMLALSYKF